eukprot:CAMPEP_0178937162 /NCGR_PEP_ID=MMETSP0786-20121207/25596_1 /TAXON_ID=186022 /ORGANISM="Thalassionema frauenfeldii, Strain CCMP 1798" /LENGTH=851 /DNA_ID=CAMNT_0020615687 /DNA_START=78 /DNA_END=2633 /DNA_ORIENTATION=+
MAKDDIPEIKISDRKIENKHTTVENDVSPPQSAAEKMHDNDSLTSIPRLLPLHLRDAWNDGSSLSSMFLTDGQISYEEDFISLNTINGNATRAVLGNLTCPASEDSSLQRRNAKEEIVYDSSPTTKEDENEVEGGSTNLALSDSSILEEATNGNHSEMEDDPTVEEEDEMVERLIVDYASKSAGALILESSSKMKGAGNLLVGDKDKYAISPCTEKKFVVIGLSEDILVKEIKVANYERYSSHVKDFQVLGSQTMGQWVVLGNFSAENKGSCEQSFELEEPSWARYLKFRFMTHYGSEHYCTLSQIKVHGSTMLQGFHEQWNEGEASNEINDETQDGIQHLETIDEGSKDEEDIINEEYRTEPNQKQGTLDSKDDAGLSSIDKESTKEKDSDTSDAKDIGKDEDVKQISPPVVKIKESKTALLLPTFDINMASIPNDLASTRFLLSSHKLLSTDSKQCQVEPLDTIAITNKMRKQRKEFGDDLKVSEDSSGSKGQQNYSNKVTDAVQTLQMKIQSTIGMTAGLHQTIQTIIGKTLPSLKASIENTSQTQNNSKSDLSQSALTTEIQPDADEDQSLEAEAFSSDASSTIVDETMLNIEVSAGLTKVLSKFPSAKCLESLNFNEFKKKTLANTSTGTGHSGSHTGKIEPIFKTLTDEIRTLQISQNVHDQFSRALIACYQNIMIEMASELHVIHNSQEQRLSKLEAEMLKMKKDNWLSNLSFGISSIIDVILFFSTTMTHGKSETQDLGPSANALMMQIFLIMAITSVLLGWFRRVMPRCCTAEDKAPRSNSELNQLRRIVSIDKFENKLDLEETPSIQTEVIKRSPRKNIGRGKFRRTVARIIAPGSKPKNQ